MRAEQPAVASILRQLVRAMGGSLEQVWRQHAPRVAVGGHVEASEFRAALDGVVEAAAVAPLSFILGWQRRQEQAAQVCRPQPVAGGRHEAEDKDEYDRLHAARIGARRKMRR